MNSNLHKARKSRDDEFYTLYEDIDKELKHYPDAFRDKIVYCNCDGPHSNFYKYFKDHFVSLGIKSLFATGFNPNGNGTIAFYDGTTEDIGELVGSGAFDTAECVKVLEYADVVVSNPPFSLYRKYIPLLMEHKKQFLVIGPINIVTYKELFPYFKDGEVGVGVNGHKNVSFARPDGSDKTVAISWYTNVPCEEAMKTRIRVSGAVKKFIRPDGTFKPFGNTHWFTNLAYTTDKGKEVILDKQYDPAKYPKYDNYDAINVDKVKDIPVDYFGVMGVPITFLTKYQPECFDVVGTSDRGGDNEPAVDAIRLTDKKMDSPVLDGEKTYKRIFIQRKPVTPNDFDVVDVENNPFIEGEEQYKRLMVQRKEQPDDLV